MSEPIKSTSTTMSEYQENAKDADAASSRNIGIRLRKCANCQGIGLICGGWGKWAMVYRTCPSCKGRGKRRVVCVVRQYHKQPCDDPRAVGGESFRP
jgi:hypothetical protein